MNAINRQTILVVDDEPANISLLIEVLKDDCAIMVATNGEKALQSAAASPPPDLVLLDVNLPDMDGYEVCSRLKADRNTRSIPVVFVTAMSDEMEECKGLELGAIDYIHKPFSTDLVRTRIRNHLELKKHRDHLEELVMENITDQVRLMEEAKIAQAKLFQADKMASLGLLVSGIAHEINNPNNFIMLNSTLLRDAWHSARPILDEYCHDSGDFCLGDFQFSESKDLLDRLFTGLIEGSRRIGNIVQKLKNFARQDSGSIYEPVDVNGAVQDAVTILNHEINKNCDRFVFEADDNLPPAQGNAQQIEQVIINLIMNALQALPERTRGVMIATTSPDEDHISICVTDEGIGMPSEVLSRLTEPFYTTKSESGGTGLGLSISASIIQEHQGLLSFESEPGAGTRVSVILNRFRSSER